MRLDWNARRAALRARDYPRAALRPEGKESVIKPPSPANRGQALLPLQGSAGFEFAENLPEPGILFDRVEVVVLTHVTEIAVAQFDGAACRVRIDCSGRCTRA